MGIVNVTPDSFSDGGVNLDPDTAAASARRMVDEGASIVDVGGESTRPGSEGVSVDEELRRVVPVLERLGGEVPLSIDTAKAEVARRALELGAELVNDVTALRGDPVTAEVVAASDAYVCLMHMLGEPRMMQADPRYDDVVSDVKAFLEERLSFAVAAGSRRTGSASTRASASARRSRTTSSCCAASTSSSRWGVRARRRVAQALPRPAARRLRGDRGATGRKRRSRERRSRRRCDDCARARRSRDRGSIAIVKIQLHGVEVFGYHGATDVEEREGQTFLFDVSLWPRQEPDADDIERTIDYREVATCVREVSDRDRVRLLETLAGSLADELMSRFAVERVRVRVRKPQVQLDPPAEYSAVTVDRP